MCYRAEIWGETKKSSNKLPLMRASLETALNFPPKCLPFREGFRKAVVLKPCPGQPPVYTSPLAQPGSFTAKVMQSHCSVTLSFQALLIPPHPLFKLPVDKPNLELLQTPEPCKVFKDAQSGLRAVPTSPQRKGSEEGANSFPNKTSRA